MNKRSYQWWLLMGLVLTVGLAGCQKATSTTKTRATSKPKSAYVTSRTPTFYVHGFQGSANSTNTLIKAATKTAHAKRVFVATVQTDGTVSLAGKWAQRTRNPIIQVVFKNNLAQYDQQTAWLAKVIKAVRARQSFDQYNIVAHSAGCVASVNLLMTPQAGNFPKLKKLVTIAGPFDGVIGEDDVANQNSFLKSGQPRYQHAAYQLLAAKKAHFPTGVRVLNIVGNLDDGTHSDGLVTNVSAQSLNGLLRGRDATITTKTFHGAHAQHSQLHENPKVAQAVNRYLWHR